MSGWISLHRKIMDHPFYTEKRKFSRYEAWIDLIMLANHQDNKFMLGNQLVEVKRGSFITSELKLMDKWDWGKEKLRGFLRLLESEQMIIKEASKYTLITICNYEKHSSKSDHDEASDSKGSEDQSDRQQTDSRPTTDRRPYTNNNVNKGNNENNKKIKEYPADTVELTTHLIDLMTLNNPNVKIPANLDKWNDEMEKLERLDKYDYMQIRSVIDWCQQDSFWKGNILSAPKLREKIATLLMQMQRPKAGASGNQRLTGFAKIQQMAREEQEREASGHY